MMHLHLATWAARYMIKGHYEAAILALDNNVSDHPSGAYVRQIDLLTLHSFLMCFNVQYAKYAYSQHSEA
jgi:hypothetical protein